MRKYTLLLSVTFHVVAALTLVIAPLFAAAHLPGISESVAWVPIRVATPPPLGDPNSKRTPSTSRSSSTTAPRQEFPVEAPSETTEETEPAGDALGGPLDDGVGRGVPDGVLGADLEGIAIAPPPRPVPPPPVEPRTPVRIGPGLVSPVKTRHVPPVYPPIALASRREGIVILEAVIAESGRVRDVRVLRSVPLLDQAAVDAVRQWEFTPTKLNGEPVPIVMTVTVNFQLR